MKTIKVTALCATRHRAIRLGFALIATSAAPLVLAAGVALEESSVGEIGNAHAGAAAVDDASTVVWNPAGMPLLKGIHFTGSYVGITRSIEFTNQGSTVGTPPAVIPAFGGNGGNAGSGFASLPSAYLTADLQPGLTAGIGVYTPFGLKIEYGSDWVGRYQSIRSKLETVNINPSIAWQPTQQWSFGGGVDIVYAEVDQTRNIDFGSICFGTPAFGPGPCTAAGILPQTRDGGVELKASSWGVGYNLGALFMPRPDMRFGLTYRSKIREDLQGQASFANPALPAPFNALTATPATQNQGVSSTLWLPESVTANFFKQLNPQWSVMGNTIWTRWSQLYELRAHYASGAPDTVTTFYWRNTWEFAVAVNYQVLPDWKIRLGYQYEQGAGRNGFRNPLVPEADHQLVAIGLNYRITPRDSVDLAYSHVFYQDTSISSAACSFPGSSQPAPGCTATSPVPNTVSGTYKSSAELFGVQYNHTF